MTSHDIRGANGMFLLDEDCIYLDHGAFGACPRPVFETYRAWQRELERSPSRMLLTRLEDELWNVREHLATYVGASPSDLALVPNATYALNTVLKSLRLEPGDELLVSEHEYGAVLNCLEFVASRSGATVVTAPGIDAEKIWLSASERTKAIIISHISSPTALRMPARRLCQLAREAEILSIVDGAHGPGQVELRLADFGADVYVGNCHKWLFSPKSAAFLFARADVQASVAPLVVGWGYRESAFESTQDWRGARDPSAYLSIPQAIAFTQAYGDQEACRDIVTSSRTLMTEAGFPPAFTDQRLQMAYYVMPTGAEEFAQARLREDFGIEVPIRVWNGQPLLRISIAPYNHFADVETLASALRTIFPANRRSAARGSSIDTKDSC